MVHEAKARIQAAAPTAEAQPDAEPAVVVTPASAPVPPSAAPTARTSAELRRCAWANAMTVVAEEFTAGLKDLAPGERWKEMARIEALTIAADNLASGASLPPVPAMAAE